MWRDYVKVDMARYDPFSQDAQVAMKIKSQPANQSLLWNQRLKWFLYA